MLVVVVHTADVALGTLKQPGPAMNQRGILTLSVPRTLPIDSFE